MALSEDARAVIAMTTRLGDTRRPSLSPTRWHRLANALKEAGLSPAAVLSDPFDPSQMPLSEELVSSIRQLLTDSARTTAAATDLDDQGIWVSTIVDSDYPKALVKGLGRLAPPVIFGAGPASTLRENGIAVVGSRNVSAEGAAVAEVIAHAVATNSYVLISGGARGVDQLAMSTAYMAGGSVIGVLADSLANRITKPDVQNAIEAARTTLISQQAPGAGFSPAAAMGRNKLIYALSQVTVVVASDVESGGTWRGAAEALRARNGLVAVWRGPGEGPGNAHLEKLGAHPVTSADDVLACLDIEREANEQLSLGD